MHLYSLCQTWLTLKTHTVSETENRTSCLTTLVRQSQSVAVSQTSAISVGSLFGGGGAVDVCVCVCVCVLSFAATSFSGFGFGGWVSLDRLGVCDVLCGEFCAVQSMMLEVLCHCAGAVSCVVLPSPLLLFFFISNRPVLRVACAAMGQVRS